MPSPVLRGRCTVASGAECAGCLNQRAKERELFAVAGKHPFGVPVDGEEKTAGALNPLHDPVRGHRIDRQAGC